MSEKAQVSIKKPEDKRENRPSQTQKAGPSQSISSPVEQILFLQRTIGNQAVGRLLKSGALQAKLRIGAQGDKYEQEADRVAERVMRMPGPRLSSSVGDASTANSTIPRSGKTKRVCVSCAEEYKTAEDENRPNRKEGLMQIKQITPLIQRLCSECDEEMKSRIIDDEKDEIDLLQRKKKTGVTPEVTPQIQSQIGSFKGGGHSLTAQEQSYFEPRFGNDFSQVRLHTDPRTAALAQAVNARAFTMGRDIVFGIGEYMPGTSEGRRLLAHELCHTIQQSGRMILTSPRVIQRTIGDGHDLTAARFSGNIVLEAVFDNERTLQNGHSGTAVQLVQQALVDLGYELPRFGVDGIFGDETEAAVRAFQVDTGTTVDGIVGFETIGFLDARVRGQPVAAAPAPVVGAALPAPNVIVQPGAAPSRPVAGIGPCIYGLTFPENVQVDIQVIRNGANWQPVVTGLIGNYSIQTRLIPTVTEVTGPGGNTIAGNFCAQVTDLNSLVNTGGCALTWYMESAILAHERIHATFFRPALVAVAPAIEASIEVLSVPHIPLLMNAAVAEMMIRALPAFATAVTNAQVLWLGQILAAGAGHPVINAATAAAERTIVDPMIARICRHAAAQGWPACSPPC